MNYKKHNGFQLRAHKVRKTNKNIYLFAKKLLETLQKTGIVAVDAKQLKSLIKRQRPARP